MEALKKIINNKFIMFLTIIYSGIIGYIFNGTFLNVKDFFYVLFNPIYTWLIILLACCFCTIYAIYLTAKKQVITKKNTVLSWLTSIIFSWSFVGQLGNADAITIVYGDILGELFITIIFCLYTYLIIKFMPKIVTEEK